MNFIQHLSGVATMASKFVDAVRGTRARIYDTRKTIPGIRNLQKYAVRMGGGTNHRMGLSDMAMVKVNHLQAVKQFPEKLLSMKSRLPKGMLLVIEAKDFSEVRLALHSRADIILLDNMPVPHLRKAIRMIRSVPGKAPMIEVSGGISLKSVRPIARLGVDRISVGALTHSAPALDVSMEISAE